ERVIQDRQFASGFYGSQACRDRLSPFQDTDVTPCMRPGEPPLHLAHDRLAVDFLLNLDFSWFATKDAEAEQVIEPAAVDTDNRYLASLQKARQGIEMRERD